MLTNVKQKPNFGYAMRNKTRATKEAGGTMRTLATLAALIALMLLLLTVSPGATPTRMAGASSLTKKVTTTNV